MRYPKSDLDPDRQDLLPAREGALMVHCPIIRDTYQGAMEPRSGIGVAFPSYVSVAVGELAQLPHMECEGGDAVRPRDARASKDERARLWCHSIFFIRNSTLAAIEFHMRITC